MLLCRFGFISVFGTRGQVKYDIVHMRDQKTRKKCFNFFYHTIIYSVDDVPCRNTYTKPRHYEVGWPVPFFAAF